MIVYSTETLDAPPVGEETAEAQVTALPEGVCGWQDRTGGDRAERGEFKGAFEARAYVPAAEKCVESVCFNQEETRLRCCFEK